MKIFNTIKFVVLGSLMCSSFHACKKAPFKEISYNNSEVRDVVNRLKYIEYKSKQSINNKSYVLYGRDTVKISDKFYTNRMEYLDELNYRAVVKTPKTIVGTHIDMMNKISKEVDELKQIPEKKYDYESRYIEQKAVIDSKKIYTKNGKDMYIPVEYYGIINPKLCKGGP